MGFTRHFLGLSKHDAAMAGGKGASLGEMSQAGIPVPPGFVLLTQAFEKFIADTDIAVEIDAVMHTVRHNEIHTVDDASEKIKALIMRAEMPVVIAEEIKHEFKNLGAQYVAVRSSATAEDSAAAAWAGQLESYLNTTEAELLENVKKCWASLFTPRAIFYRFEKFGVNTHLQKISVAVVVQKMVESEISGIAFSVHPVTQDYNQLIIEAGLGLGEAIVSGQITPDSYVVEKSPRRILDKNIVTQTRGMFRAAGGGSEWREVPKEHGEPPALTDIQILDLSELVLKIESHYGFPCDIEWAYEATKFYIVQSRPITTLSKQSDKVTETAQQYNPQDYIRMFAQKSFPYLFSNIFLGYYNSLGVISVTGENNWISFFPKALLSFTNQEGKKLYTSKTSYQKYKQEFDNYIKESGEYFKVSLQKNKLSGVDVKEFFQHVSNLFIWYSKTEFFYTDGVKPDELAITVKEFDELKLGGRAYLNSLFFEANGYGKSFIRQIAQQSSVSESDLLNHSVSELERLIDGGEKLMPDEVSRRHTFFESKDTTLFGSEAQPLIDKFFADYLGTADIIKGTIANKGKVRGKARVLVPDAKDFDKIVHAVKEMREGEILVAETTSPDIIVACKKAAAIVTNQGGQLSHAAIVSRELGIPCIIGTDKDVILNIKTGDELEVDAINGVVKIMR